MADTATNYTGAGWTALGTMLAEHSPPEYAGPVIQTFQALLNGEITQACFTATGEGVIAPVSQKTGLNRGSVVGGGNF